MSYGLTSEKNRLPSPHLPGGTYDVQYQEEGSMDILDSDDEGNEFPAAAGWYYKQFIHAPRTAQEWVSIDGWFGPFVSVDDMPPTVRDNLTRNTSNQ